MKNKIFSLMALAMFGLSLMSVAPITAAVDCTAVAADVQTKMQKKGHDHLTSNDAADAAYDACMDNGGTMNGA